MKSEPDLDEALVADVGQDHPEHYHLPEVAAVDLRV